MTLNAIQAIPHALGNRIDISWEYSPDATYDGVRVVRKEGSYPTNFDDGVFVASIDTPSTVARDEELEADSVYYYMLFPFTGTPPVYDVDVEHRTSAYATANNGFSDFLYQNLPEIYRRYDRNTESLKEFLSIPGGQLNLLHSYIKSIQDLKNQDKVHGNLLPILGQWIGWKTDFKRDISAQRDEVKNAPAIYKRVELLPTIEATVKRISNWENKTKEYVHNVWCSNRPEELNLWLRSRANDNTWQEDSNFLSMDSNFEGNSSLAIDSNNIRWLVYHTQRKGQWEIWCKTSPVYYLSSKLLPELVNGNISIVLLDAINQHDLTISQIAMVSSLSTNSWEIADGLDHYILEAQLTKLALYHDSSDMTEFSPSEPLAIKKNALLKYPSIEAQGSELWMFNSVYEPDNDHWSITYRSREEARWSTVGPAEDPTTDIFRNPFAEAGVYNPILQRRCPYAVLDDQQRLWLFWLENNGLGWTLRYNRHEAGAWAEPVSMPLDGTDDPRVVKDIQILLQPVGLTPLIYVFWSRPSETSTPGMVRWEIAYRVKEDFNLDANNWTAINSLPKDLINDDHHDREPYALINNNQIEVFYSSNRQDTGWNVWNSILSDYTVNSWEPQVRISTGNYSQRCPLAFLDGDITRLFYRSNHHVSYSSEVYRATETNDLRYSGSLTVDMRNRIKIDQWSAYQDYQTYTYDTGTQGVRGDENRIARDTVGIFLETDSYVEDEVESGIERLRPVVGEFMPLTDRAVFIPNSDFHVEFVYNYGQPVSPSSNFINSSYQDVFNGELTETVLSDGEDFMDNLG